MQAGAKVTTQLLNLSYVPDNLLLHVTHTLFCQILSVVHFIPSSSIILIEQKHHLDLVFNLFNFTVAVRNLMTSPFSQLLDYISQPFGIPSVIHIFGHEGLLI